MARSRKSDHGNGVEPGSVERLAFELLFSTGRPLPPGRLAETLTADRATMASIVAELEQEGVVQCDADGSIVGVSGLSVEPTPHEFVIDDVRRWTWCAFDALGFVASVRRGGVVRSRCPETGSPVVVRFFGKQVEADPPDAVVVFADRPEGRVREVWCPLVNLFEAPEAARRWMEHHGISGEIQTPGESASTGVRRFARFFADDPS